MSLHAALSSPSTSGRPSSTSFPAEHSFLPNSSRAGYGSRTQRRKEKWIRLNAVAESTLVDWLGLQQEKLPFIEKDGGLVLTKPVAKNTAIFSIPASKWITKDTVAASPIAKFVGRLPPWLQITLWLMSEKGNTRSSWATYIAELPSVPDTPIVWSDAELEKLLSGTQLIDAVISYRNFFSQKFLELEQQIFSKDRQIFPESSFSEEEFLRVAVLLRSRIHPPLTESNVALVPLADKVQHQRGAGVAWKRKAGGFGRGEEALVVEAQDNLEAGQTLTMDFGPDKLDSDLVLNYGVLDEFVSRSGFPLSLEVPEDDRFVDDKLDILDINGFQGSQEFMLTTSEEPTVDLLAYLRLINLSGPDAFLLESLFRNEAWGFLQMPVSQENETAVFTSMIDGCKEALAGYGSSLSDDKDQLKSAEPGSRTEKALRIRCGEKEALLATLQFFEEKYERLGELEYYQERRLKGLGLLDDDGGTTYDSFFRDGIA